jgi:hypothetical protein
LTLNKSSKEDSGSGAGDYETGEQDQRLHGQSKFRRSTHNDWISAIYRG